ncbi:MAG: type pilus assembly protein PilW [Pseudomonadota bacterium]|jgi:type IV pilus assembly protein PilW
MDKPTQRGFSLIELMIAVVLAMLTVLVVMQVLSVYEARKRTTTAGNDAEISAAVGLFMIEREVRMTGAGLTLPGGFACNVGINIYFDGDTISDGQILAPVVVTDGGAGPDLLRVLRSTSPFGIAPATIVKSMPTPSSILTVDGSAGLADGDMFIVAGADGNKLCTLMQMTQDAQSTGNGWNLNHNSGKSDYNPPNPNNVFDTAIRYDIGDLVINLGPLGMRTFGVICSDGAAPAAGNNCDLVGYDPLVAPATPALADADSITSQVVDFQVQYGIAPAGNLDVNDWVDATGGTWAAPTAANVARIKAIRMAIVTRGNREPTMVSPAQIVLWDAGAATERTRDLTDEERRYRYKVLTVVVPLINVIWAGV